MTVDSQVTEAHEAFLKAQTASLEERAGWMDAAAESLESRRQDLVAVAEKETFLPEGRLHTELTRTTFQLRLLAEEVRKGEFLDATIDHADAEWGMGPRPDIRRVNVPLGVVGVFGASNFPFAFSVAGGDTASALAAGCSVVHKIHGGHEGLGRLTAEILEGALAEAGAPRGIFSAITGRESGIELVEHPKVKAVGFTGSVHGGRALFDRAAARPEPIPFFGELGSINPVVVTQAAWDKRAAEIVDGFVGSMTMGIGQFCTKPGLLFVPGGDLQGIKDTLGSKLESVDLPNKMLNQRICDGFIESRNHVSGLVGVEALATGNDANPPTPAAFYVRASDLTPESEVLHQEMFGPAAVVIGYESREELEAVLRVLPGQLTGTLQSENGEDIEGLASTLSQSCGRLIKNAWPTGVTVSYAQHHGGPYPAATAQATSVGTAAVSRFLRPVAYQGFSDGELPPSLQEVNPLNIRRRVDGAWTN